MPNSSETRSSTFRSPPKPPSRIPRSSESLARVAPHRPEIAKLVTASLEYTQDVRVPGMLHARNVRPPVAGSTLVSVDGFDGGEPTGLVKVVSKGNYVAVVAKTEWQAIQASHQLKVTWKKPPAPVLPDGYEALYDYLAKTAPQAVATPVKVGDVDAALASAARTITATYYSSFQSHASMTPGCCIADVKDGGAIIWFGGHKPYRVRMAVADFLGIPSSKVRVIFYQGAGLLRYQRHRRRRRRSSLDLPAARPARSPPMDARRRHRLGSQRRRRISPPCAPESTPSAMSSPGTTMPACSMVRSAPPARSSLATP